MLIAYRLGRVPSKDSSRYALVDRMVGRFVTHLDAHDDVEGLRLLRERAKDLELVAEPALEAAAATFAVPVVELTKNDRFDRAHAAVSAFGEGVFDHAEDPAVRYDFFEAVRQLEPGLSRIRSWRGVVRLQGTLGGVTIDHDAAVTVIGDPEPVVMMIPVADLPRAEVPSTDLEELDGLFVAFRRDPEALRLALADAYALTWIPAPYARRDRRTHRVQGPDLDLLAMAIEAAAANITQNAARLELTPMTGTITTTVSEVLVT